LEANESVKNLASQLGFRYRYVKEQKEYAHGAAIFVLTPEGKISRYLYGIEFPAKTLRLALLEASNGAIGTVVDRVKLFCYRYDPASRSYSLVAFRLVQLGSVLTLVALGILLTWLKLRERQTA